MMDWRIVGCALASVLAASASIAHAQVAGYQVPGEQAASFTSPALARSGLFTREGEVGVLQRQRPEYGPPSIRLGSFDLQPSVTGTVLYDDNIFARPAQASDAIFKLRPEFLLESDTSGPYLSLFGRAADSFYLDHSDEGTIDYAIGTNDRMEVARALGVGFGASYERDTEPRTSPSSPINAAEPVRFNVAKAYVGGVRQFNRVRLSLSANVRDFSYDDVAAIGGGSIVERDRSHLESSLDAKAEYAVTPAASLFVEAIGDRRDFRDELPGAPKRDSRGYDLTVGSDFEVTRLVRGEFQLGYLNQRYDDSRFPTVSGLSVRGYVQYFPVSVLTLGVYGSRSVQDAEVAGSSGYLQSVAKVQADYEFLRQLILSGQVQYENDDFRGVDRSDDLLSESLSAQYLINRSVGIVLAYSHVRQRSSGALRGVDYDDNRLSTSLIYKF